MVVSDCCLNSQTLGDGIGQRFLQIDILDCLQGVDGHQGMPMVGCGYLYGIDILAFQQSLIFFIHITTLGHAFIFLPFGGQTAETLTLDAIHITACCNLNTRTTCEGPEVAASLLAYSHEAQYHAV